ncbi:hypothetical protein Ancab_012221 [Ancistrocladus abbreviatus]
MVALLHHCLQRIELGELLWEKLACRKEFTIASKRHFCDGGKPGPAAKCSMGAELFDGLVIQGDYKLVKTRFSAFFGTHLHSFLHGVGIESLVVVGVQTPNCIRQTVFDAVALDYPSVCVIVDATAAATPEIHAGVGGSDDRECMERRLEELESRDTLLYAKTMTEKLAEYAEEDTEPLIWSVAFLAFLLLRAVSRMDGAFGFSGIGTDFVWFIAFGFLLKLLQRAVCLLLLTGLVDGGAALLF